MAVYLPPNFDDSGKTLYPLIFLLSGWGSRSSKYLNSDSAFGRSIPDQLDELILAKQLPACIIVCPDGTSKLGHSQYINSPSTGHYMDYLCDELVALVDEKYPTFKSADKRAVMGHSSGGYGALAICAERPDVFKYFCSSAGDSFFEASVLPGLVPSVSCIESSGGVENFIHEFLSHPNPGGLGHAKFMTMLTLSLAPLYCPSPNNGPLYGELFFDPSSGAIHDDIWNKWLEHDPLRFIQKKITNVAKSKLILLDCGLQDEHAAQWGHRQIAQILKKEGVQHELREYSGRHSGQNWRFPERMELILKEMMG